MNLRQKDFKYLGSNELYMKFKADFGTVGKGFNIDVKCRSAKLQNARQQYKWSIPQVK